MAEFTSTLDISMNFEYYVRKQSEIKLLKSASNLSRYLHRNKFDD